MSPAHHSVDVLASRQAVDQESVQAMVQQEAAQLGIDVTIRWTQQPSQDEIDGTAAHPLVVLTDSDEPDLTWLPVDGARTVIRLDLALRELDRSPGLFRHIQGRGIDGVRWALRVGHYHSRRPAVTVAYGPHAEQFGEFRAPDGESPEDGWPLAVLLHGGFWRSRWELDLMDALAIDLADRGVASWNVEYRRPDRHGWAATVDDVTAALGHLPTLGTRQRVDAGRAAVAGHSAGGQLAVQVCADLAKRGGPVPRLAVSLAGLVDLVQTHRRDLGNGAVPAALGGTPEQVPEVYAAASPLLRLPVPLDQLVVVGTGDGPDLREMSRRYVRAAGPRARLLEDAGDHFSVIDPASVIWQRTVESISDALVG